MRKDPPLPLFCEMCFRPSVKLRTVCYTTYYCMIRENHSFRSAAYLKTCFQWLCNSTFFKKCTKNFCYQTASILFSYTYRTLNTKFYSLSCIQDFNPFLLWKTRTKKYIFLNEEWKSEFSHTVVCQGPPLTEVGDVRGVKLKFSVKMAIKAHN